MFQRLCLFLQGDDSLSAITFDSDFETVSDWEAAACPSWAAISPCARITHERAAGLPTSAVLGARGQSPDATWRLKPPL